MGTRRFRSINSKRLSIFVVEDHPDVRDLFTLFLPTLGHWVESTGNAGAALERLSQGGFDVLLTDLWQSNEQGWCLLQELRARDSLPPYVVATGGSFQSNAVQSSQAAGCFAHLQQPFRLPEMEQVLEDICLAARAPAATRRHPAADLPGVLINPTFRAEAQRLRAESRLLCAVVAHNIASCRQAVAEARKTLVQRQKDRFGLTYVPPLQAGAMSQG